MSVPAVKLNPSSKFLLKHVPKNIDYSQMTIEKLRSNPSPVLSDEIPRPKVTIKEIQVPADGHLVTVQVYRPAGADNAILPVLVYLHGGGWNLGPQGAHDYLATKLAGDTHCSVLFVRYSLSPEVRFPVAVEECYAVVEWVSQSANAATLNVDPTRIAVGGDSAGGNLTISTTLLAKQRNLENKIKYQVLYYPATDVSFSSESYKQFGDDYLLTKGLTQFFVHNYLTEQDYDNILAVPLKATVEDVTDLPPALVITGEADVLRDEGEAYAHKLLEANVPVTSFRVQGVIHGFMSIPALHSAEALQVIDLTTSSLRRAFQ